MLTGLLAFGANTLAAVFLVPQLVRLVRHRDVAGVSATWIALGIVTNTVWVLYLGRLGLWAGVPAPALALVTYALMLLVVARLERHRIWLGASIAYLVSMAGIGHLGGEGALGLVLALSPTIQILPALVAVFRESRPSGVSPATWLLGTGEATLWGAFGWLVHDLALVGYGLLTTTGSVLILARWLVVRHRVAPRASPGLIGMPPADLLISSTTTSWQGGTPQ